MPNFLDLPPEIRNAIYRLICVAEGPAQINAIAIDLRSAFPDDPRPRFTFASPLTETEVRFSVVDEQLRFYNTLWIINGKLRYEMITFLLSENPIMTRHRLSPLEGVLGTSMSYVRRLVLLPDMSSKVRRPPEGQRFLREIGFASKSLPNLECLDFYMSVAKHSGLQCSQNASEASEDFELAFGLEHGECERRAVLTDIKADDASFTLNNMVNAATSSAISSCKYGGAHSRLKRARNRSGSDDSDDELKRFEWILNLKRGFSDGGRDWTGVFTDTICPDLLCVAWSELKAITAAH